MCVNNYQCIPRDSVGEWYVLNESAWKTKVYNGSMQLSKSDYMLFLRHPAWLWLKKNDKKKLPDVDDALQAIFDTGHRFEQYPEQQFPYAVLLGFDEYEEYRSLPRRTNEALANGAKTILQGRFEYKQFTFICDVIDVIDDKTVDLYEIKSSTSAKTDHEYDLAFQLMVLEGCGYKVRNIAVMHVNNEYVRQGEVDAAAITATTDITRQVKALLDKTKQYAEAALKTALQPNMPDPSPVYARMGSYKDWLEIYKTLQPLPENSFYELGGVNAKAIELFESHGITTIDDIAETLEVSKRIDGQLRAYRNGGPIVDQLRIKEFLNTLEYPLYFFDYETLSSLVPYFDGMRPYAQYPFQYSLHVIDSPDSELRHEEYLHTENSNPAEGIVAAMQSHFGDSGSILTWNMSFEKGCNDTLAKFVPGASEFLQNINERIVDLMTPFSSGAYNDYRFRGSASIKNVLPVVVPELSYKVLGIQEGGAAQRLWMEAVLDGKHEEEKDKVLNDLVEYCKLDTLAMVEIYKVLRNL